LSQNEATIVQRSSNAVPDSALVEHISQLGFTAHSPLSGCKVATIAIDGITCISCVRSIEACLSAIDGVKSSVVSLSSHSAEVVFDSSVLTTEQICDAINNCGFVAKTKLHGCSDAALPVKSDDSLNSVVTGTVHIEGMTCGSCVKHIEETVIQLNGVINIRVSLPDKMATVEFNSAVTSISAIANEISDMGFEATPDTTQGESQVPALSAKASQTDVVPSSFAYNDVMISVNGMTCDACVNSVQTCITGLPGVTAVKVSLQHNMAHVTLTDQRTTAADVAAAVSDIGFDASVFHPSSNADFADIPSPVAYTELVIGIHGMHCNSCTRAIEGQVSSAVGVRSVVVSLLDETARIHYDAQLISAEQLRNVIEKTGNFEAYIGSDIGN